MKITTTTTFLFLTNAVNLVTSSIRLPVLHQSQLPTIKTIVGDPIHIDGDYKRDGEFFMNVTIGDQPFSLLIDTGSSDLGLAAVGCNGCTKKFHQYYDPSSSANPMGCDFCKSNATKDTSLRCQDRGGKEKQCTYIVSYEDDSGFSAALYEDDLKFSPKLKVRAAVGAMYEAKFPNPRAVDGIIGFADLDVASSGATTPYLELVESGLIEDVFSLCLTSNGGVMYLGEESFLSDDRIVWTSRLRSSGYYGITIDDVTIDGKSIDVPSKVFNDGTAIVDSGTSDTCFSSTAFKAIKSHFGSLCKTTCLKGVCDCEAKKPLQSQIFESRCVRMNSEDRALFPDIKIKMNDGAIVSYTPDAYLRSGDVVGCDDEDLFTIAISSNGPDGSGSILGDSFMMSYVVIHDRRNHRIGFLELEDGKCP